MNSPVNEIFKSLTSLQKELNEQNLKQKNLEKVKQFLFERKGVLSEDFKSQEQNYINQGNDPQIVKTYIERFRKIKDKNYKQIDSQDLNNILKHQDPKDEKKPFDRRNIDSYKTFEQLEAIVDYVSGQIDLAGASLGSDIEIDAKPIYEDDIFQIYYADSPRACIKYKGNIPYSWCVSRNDSSNMFYTYRFKEHEPAFYFVKVKDRTKKELGFFSMVGNVFNGQFKDKYHFFVLQTLKNAKIGDTTRKQYVITSAMNDGDTQMSWDDIIGIEPRIANLQEIFKSVELSPEDRKFYDKYYEYGTNDETFCKLDYTSKRRYLDIYIRQEKLLTDKQFQCLPEDLMNLYLGFGVGLSENQFELIKTNKNLLKRYKQITERKLEEYIKNKNQQIKFNYTEILIVPEIVMKLDTNGFRNLLQYSSKENIDKIINTLINVGGREFIMNSNLIGFHILLEKSSEPDKIINALINIGGKEFIMNLELDSIQSLLNNSSEPDKIINLLGNKGKEYIMNFNVRNIQYMKNPENFVNFLINIGGEEFIMKLSHYGTLYLLKYSSEPDKIISILNDKFKEFIMKLQFNDIYLLLEKSSEPDKIINALINIGGKEFIMNLDRKSVKYLLQFSSEPDKIINALINIGGKEFIMNNLTFEMIANILAKSSEPEKIKQILQKYGKLPKEETTTPINEIFKSLTSLQEELNEQNKVTIKKRNLEKVKQFLLERQDLLDEKDNRQVIVNKLGLSQAIADFAHEMSDKYSLWIANSLKDYLESKQMSSDLYNKLQKNYFTMRPDISSNYQDIIVMLKDDNKPNIDIKNLSFEDGISLYSKYNYIKDWRDNPNTQTPNLKNMSWEEAERLSTEWHENLNAGGQVDNILDDKDEIIHKFSDGFYWVLRKDSYCEKSKDSMGHCAKATESDMYLLRLIKNNEEFITADWNPNKKYIKQLKGKKNSKPKKEYHPYIMWLIADSGLISELKTNQGYKIDTNFQLSDLDGEQLKYVLNGNKEILNKEIILDLLFKYDVNKVINLIGLDKIKESIMYLTPININNLLKNSSEPNKVINTLFNIGGKEFIVNVVKDSSSLFYLLNNSSEPDKVINTLFNIGGKEFIMNLTFDAVDNILKNSSEPEKIKKILKQYEEPITPMNEIFKSLTSLQEELTEQRKVTIKESNLMKIQNFIKKRKSNQ